MEERIRNIVIAKCQQLTKGMSVRATNVVAWLIKDVENRLVPIVRGTADVRRIPSCGENTAKYIDGMLQELRPFYERLMEQPLGKPLPDEFTSIISAPTAVPQFSFPPQDDDAECRIQAFFEEKAEGIGDRRTLNLIHNNLKHYRDAEVYIDNPLLLWNWRGAGKMTVERIKRFLEEFNEEYQLHVFGQQTSGIAALKDEYPFLTIGELSFVDSFLRAHKRYPVWFIALRYFQQADDRPSQVFARANGLFGNHEHHQALAEEFDLTSERIRQLSRQYTSTKLPGTREKFPSQDNDEVSPVWSRERWAALECFHQSLLMKDSMHWADLCRLEHLGNLDFYAGLAILSIVRPIRIVTAMVDGSAANVHRAKGDSWQHPDIIFGFDTRLSGFDFGAFIKYLGHEANLMRIDEKIVPLQTVARGFFSPDTDEAACNEVFAILAEVLPLLTHVEVEANNVVLKSNHINYFQTFYNILQERGEAMTLDEIYAEFRLLHPDDHHTDSSFIRTYLLRDKRFEAVGKKSTYQLREWKRFAGPLGDLALALLADSEEPMLLAELSGKMLEARRNTTQKSCESSIYLAVVNEELRYFMTEESPSTTAYVGLATRQYPSRYWLSTLTVDGAVAAIRRFLAENLRWPFASNKEGIEGVLYYTFYKYTHKLHITEEEYKRFQRGMADIKPYLYPANEREAIFIARCKTLLDFRKKHHRMPTKKEEPLLVKWYVETLGKRGELDKLRKFYFGQITKGQRVQPEEQLSLNFLD